MRRHERIESKVQVEELALCEKKNRYFLYQNRQKIEEHEHRWTYSDLVAESWGSSHLMPSIFFRKWEVKSSAENEEESRNVEVWIEYRIFKQFLQTEEDNFPAKHGGIGKLNRPSILAPNGPVGWLLMAEPGRCKHREGIWMHSPTTGCLSDKWNKQTKKSMIAGGQESWKYWLECYSSNSPRKF